jgi:hypothetical protein
MKDNKKKNIFKDKDLLQNFWIQSFNKNFENKKPKPKTITNEEFNSKLMQSFKKKKRTGNKDKN